jgi:CPA2 family monovalent cation:H+ antiporter-2
MHDEYALLVYLSVGLAAALLFGFATERLRLSPIVGYLLAGIIVGPNTPGFVADTATAVQLAEIGVVLLMFGVGLHFNLRDLWAVRRIALPGAIGQIVAATTLGTIAACLLGWGLTQGVIIGIAISVASTVVLVRMLTDNDLIDTSQGHIAVGWLIVEDIFTVLVLVALPAIADIATRGSAGGQSILGSLVIASVKIGILAVIVLGGGQRLIPWLLAQVARTRSRELFTLSILALALAIATGSAVFFGVSMALGAFLAGIVVGQSEVSHQAAADALPMRDAFAVLFFVSVGMLFDPQAILREPLFLFLMLAIVLIAKPLAALTIVWGLRYSFRSAFTVAIALAQVGEFSFLLADEAIRHELLSDKGRSVLIACAIISISINPLLFRTIGPVERWLRAHPHLWRILSQRAESGGAEINKETQERLSAPEVEPGATPSYTAVIVGYGPVGQTAARILRNFNIEPVVIDLNLDTVRDLGAVGKLAIYGDATRRDILEAAGIEKAKYLLVTIPDFLVRTLVIITAKEINSDVRVFVRARYLQERAWLEEIGATEICTEEAEAALGLAFLLLREVGADQEQVHREIRKLHDELSVRRSESDFQLTDKLASEV